MKKLCLLFVVLPIFSIQIYAKDPDVAKEISRLKNKSFILKVNEAVFDPPSIGFVHTSYKINAESIPKEYNEVFYIPGRLYTIVDVKYDKKKDTLLVKLRNRKESYREIQLNFSRASTLAFKVFEEYFYNLFLRSESDLTSYKEDNYIKMINVYFSEHPELTSLSHEDQVQLIKKLENIENKEITNPALERLNDILYLQIEIKESTIYNDLQVNKMQRLASSIEKVAQTIISYDARLSTVQPIDGISFNWRVAHCNFPANTCSKEYDDIQMYILKEDLKELLNGNLSMFELANMSLVRVNGIKTTFTSWEPTGGS